MAAGPALGTALTARERETALLVAEGLTDRQVAGRLFVSERTVHAHLRAAYRKTGARNRVQLVNWLAEHDASPEAGGDSSPGERDASIVARADASHLTSAATGGVW